MGNPCGPKPGVAHFSGRKNQAHNGKWCVIPCSTAKHSNRIPTPARCGTSKSSRRKTKSRRR